MVAIDPVTKYRRPILSRASTTKRSRSDCSMGEPPRHFLLKAPLIPVRVLGGEMAGDHAPGGPEEVACDLQALGSRHDTEDLRHFVVHHLDIPWVDPHSRIILPVDRGGTRWLTGYVQRCKKPTQRLSGYLQRLVGHTQRLVVRSRRLSGISQWLIVSSQSY